MSIETPKSISREEKYLDKIGGNEEVIVPKPISREEKYMYRAAGYDDQPIPDYPISRNEKYWAKIIENGGGSEIGSTVAFDSGQKFISDNSSLKDYKIYGNGGEVHSTGVLPLTFTAKGGNMADWVIYGNDDNGTENLFDIETQIVGEGLDTNGSAVPSQTSNRSDYIAVNAETDYCQYNNVIDTTYRIFQFFDANKELLSFVAVTVSNKTHVFATPQNCAFCRISYPKNSTEVMLVKGSTAPDHYIPYQQGVGERTRNLFDCRKNNNGYTDITVAGVRFLYGNQSITLSQTANGMYPQQQIKGEDGILTLVKNTQYYGKLYVDNAPENANIYMLLQASTDGSSYTTIATIRSAGVTFTPNDDYTVYRWLFVAEGEGFTYNNTVVKFAILEGSTAPDHYIPYGYQIPLTVSQQGQTDKNYDIYIGDSPLTEGETVSKTSTGVDIELFEGENTVSTTLYNKPTMEIEASYGVGVKDNNHYIIPFKVNTTIYNIQIGDSPLYDGEYLSYKEKKLYKYIDSVLTPIDPPSPFPEISTTEGVNKVIIETSTQPDSIFITTQNPIKLVQPNIGTKTITQNGVYNASDDNLDGYSSVTVNTN